MGKLFTYEEIYKVLPHLAEMMPEEFRTNEYVFALTDYSLSAISKKELDKFLDPHLNDDILKPSPIRYPFFPAKVNHV